MVLLNIKFWSNLNFSVIWTVCKRYTIRQIPILNKTILNYLKTKHQETIKEIEGHTNTVIEVKEVIQQVRKEPVRRRWYDSYDYSGYYSDEEDTPQPQSANTLDEKSGFFVRGCVSDVEVAITTLRDLVSRVGLKTLTFPKYRWTTEFYPQGVCFSLVVFLLISTAS